MVARSWRRVVNRALDRLTGHVVVRSSVVRKQRKAAARAVKQLAAANERATAAVARERAARKPKPPRPEFPADVDEQAREVIRAVQPYTMTSMDKLFGLISATRYLARNDIPGAVVECGVWRGGSMHAVARTLLSVDETSRHLYLFDTFQGMPPPSDKDVRHDGSSAAELLEARSRKSNIWAVATLDDVKEGFAQLAYPAGQVHFVEGLVEDTVPDNAPEQIALLRLDTDWYESTRHELEHLYPRLVSGGVLIVDDYGYWRGSKQAMDEFLDATGERLLLLRAGTGRIAIKP